MRALTQGEIALLQFHNIQHTIKTKQLLFTDEDMKDLAENKASFKVFRIAEKIIEGYTNKMNEPIPRAEAISMFYSQKEFGKFYKKHIMPILREHICLVKLLVGKGQVTNEELDAAVEQFEKDAAEANKAPQPANTEDSQAGQAEAAVTEGAAGESISLKSNEVELNQAKDNGIEPEMKEEGHERTTES